MHVGISYEEMIILLRLKERLDKALSGAYPGIEDIEDKTDVNETDSDPPFLS